MQQLAVLNDKIVPFEKLQPVYLDRGTFFGDGVYEVVRSYNGKIFALDEHLGRFAASLAAIGIENVQIDQIRTRLLTAFKKAAIPNAKIYFHVTRGSAPRNHLAPEALKPNFFLTITELPENPDAKNNGIAVATHPDWRWKRCDIKSLNLLPNVLARRYAARKGCDEAILVDDNGLITEGAASAFFAILGRTLQTAPLSANILPSITRRYVIKAAENLSLQLIEQALSPHQAARADELFIAVTTHDILPVVRFDDAVIADGRPGKYVKSLIQEFRKFTL